MGLYSRVAELPVRIESLVLEGRVRPYEGRFERRTTVFRLEGAGEAGLGEDVNYEPTEQRALVAAGLDYPLGEALNFGELESLLDGLDLFREEPRYPEARAYRRWALSSAALDLALRQQGTALSAVLGLETRAVRFVKSMGLRGPSIEPIRRLLERMPDLELKLDASPRWTDATVDALRETGAVRVVDLKGAYHGTPVDLAPDPELYRRIALGLPDAWIEDPGWTDRTAEALEPYRDRVTWDAPIHSVANIEALPYRPRCLNMKPSRFGSLRRLFEAYDWCAENRVEMYGGGQFELGPGRGQAQYLASMFHAEAPNDVAPIVYHDLEANTERPPSPLTPAPSRAGFAWETEMTETR